MNWLLPLFLLISFHFACDQAPKSQLPDNTLDLVVMKHEIEFQKNNQQYTANSTLKVEGENSIDTAMAKTVGAPLFEGLKLIINNEIKETGVIIPTSTSIFTKVLKRLKNHRITFDEHIKTKD